MKPADLSEANRVPIGQLNNFNQNNQKKFNNINNKSKNRKMEFKAQQNQV